MEKNNYPLTRRRLRTDTYMRELTAGVKLSHKNFIQPLFAEEGLSNPRSIAGLGSVQVDTTETLLRTIGFHLQSGISKFLLFPVPAKKYGNEFDFSFATRMVKAIRNRFGADVWLSVDLCLCSYTTHGHCGLLNEDHSALLNSPTVELLSRYAAQLAAAGADCIAPSDMTDGRVGAIRITLDALGFENVSIMSYAAKFSSQFYGPFRDACQSSPNTTGLRNRKSYQLSPFNPGDAIATALRDEQEGADILMVKPAALYTDIIAKLKESTLKPLAAYHVSGEYAAIEALAEKGLVKREAAHVEVWAALGRAGADIIISYASGQAKKWIDRIEY